MLKYLFLLFWAYMLPSMNVTEMEFVSYISSVFTLISSPLCCKQVVLSICSYPEVMKTSNSIIFQKLHCLAFDLKDYDLELIFVCVCDHTNLLEIKFQLFFSYGFELHHQYTHIDKKYFSTVLQWKYWYKSTTHICTGQFMNLLFCFAGLFVYIFGPDETLPQLLLTSVISFEIWERKLFQLLIL